MKTIKNTLSRSKFFLLLTFSYILLTGCATQQAHPLFTASESVPIKEYNSFAEYVAQTEENIIKNRYFLTNKQQEELQANLPYEIKPTKHDTATKGILLVHGLGDSPYYFVDISEKLASQGFLVRTILLPGHGTRPADLLGIDYQDWQNLVAKQVALLKKEVKKVYLGGFSTGANLVYAYASQDYDIQGLILFSPAFKANEPLLFMTPLLACFSDWIRPSSPDRDTNYARYTTVPTNAFAQYYKTSKNALNIAKKSFYTRPVFMVLSEHDSVLDTKHIKEIFDTRFINSKSRLIWYGHTPSRINAKTRFINSHIPHLRISNMSHMGILFSPSNPYYGMNGSERICTNAPDALQSDMEACKKGESVWYSAWIEDERHLKSPHFHARLTFNPEFDLMMHDLFQVLN